MSDYQLTTHYLCRCHYYDCFRRITSNPTEHYVATSGIEGVKSEIWMSALNDVKVLDVASMMAAPYSAALLGDMGADVVKLEPPRGDEARHIGPRSGSDSAIFVGVNRNKRGICADLRSEGGREVLHRLVRWADVVIDNMRTPAKKRFGLDFNSLSNQNDGVIAVSVSTYGNSGPYGGRPGVDPVAQALSGFMEVTGESDGRPLKAGPPVGDATASLLMAYGAMAALWERERSGKGQAVEVALVDGLIHIQAPYIGQYFLLGSQKERMGNSSDWYGPYNSFICRDSKLIQVAALNDKFFTNLCGAIGQPELASDPKFSTNVRRLENRAHLERILQTFFSTVTRSEACFRLSEYDVIFAPINSYEEALTDPQVIGNGMVQTVEHQNVGSLKVTGVPVKLSETPGSIRGAPPALGEHSEEVLRELGFEAGDIGELLGSGEVQSGRPAEGSE